MNVAKVPSKTLILEVHSVDIYRMHSGPDRVILTTNMPNPCHPYTGTLTVKLEVTRGKGPRWAAENLPGVDMELYDAEKMRAGGQLHLANKR